MSRKRNRAKANRRERSERARRGPVLRPEEEPFPDEMIARFLPRGHLKMSEVLLAFAEPIVVGAPDLETHTRALQIAVAAWNHPLLPPEEARLAKQSFCREILDENPRAIAQFEELLPMLLERKRQLFPDLPHFIGNVEVTEDDDGYHVFVLWSPDRFSSPLPVRAVSWWKALALLPVILLMKLVELCLRALLFVLDAFAGQGFWMSRPAWLRGRRDSSEEPPRQGHG